jgi:predicted component of type VI protein secretion system
MELNLIVAEGKHEGKVIPIQGKQFVIGRHEKCQLRPASESVSKHHCAVLLRGGHVIVRDFESSNGTFVNGERVRGDRELRNEDCLEIGPLVFLVWIIRDGADCNHISAQPMASPDESDILDLLLAGSRGALADGVFDDDEEAGSTIQTRSFVSVVDPRRSRPSSTVRRIIRPSSDNSPEHVRDMIERFRSRIRVLT